VYLLRADTRILWKTPSFAGHFDPVHERPNLSRPMITTWWHDGVQGRAARIRTPVSDDIVFPGRDLHAKDFQESEFGEHSWSIYTPPSTSAVLPSNVSDHFVYKPHQTTTSVLRTNSLSARLSLHLDKLPKNGRGYDGASGRGTTRNTVVSDRSSESGKKIFE